MNLRWRLAAACLGGLLGVAAAAQVLDLDWSDGLSDVPIVDLSGTWRYDPARSDPLIEEWQGLAVDVRIYQQPDRIVLQLVPAELDQRILGYRWDGTLRSERRESTEIRERARWTQGGRVLEVEGRWWTLRDDPEIRRYVHRYRLDGSRALVLSMDDEFGTTVWHFDRRG